jgi:hypothetical protein
MVHGLELALDHAAILIEVDVEPERDFPTQAVKEGRVNPATAGELRDSALLLVPSELRRADVGW